MKKGITEQQKNIYMIQKMKGNLVKLRQTIPLIQGLVCHLSRAGVPSL